jgi:chemotaxis protein methyltransferase CheR
MTTVADAPAKDLDPHDFEFLRSFLMERSAIVLGEDKHYLVASRLGPVARQFGIDSVAGVVQHIRATSDEEVATSVVEAMTINETLWFRDVKPFAALRQHVIPTVMERNQATRRLSVWSAASSTGQELYSVAMTLQHDFPQLEGWNVSLVGTDINATVLEKARAGKFSSLEINRGLPADMMARYFTRDGASYVIDESIRKVVSFSQMNLAGTWSAFLPTFDVILLRNVLIYFDNPTKERIIASACKQLAPSGFLFLGSAETVFNLSTELVPVNVAGTTVYEKGAA